MSKYQELWLSLHVYMDYGTILKFAELFSEAVASRNDYMREYMKNRYHAKRNAIIQELGGKCSACSSQEKPLHIDHIDADKKTFRASDVHSTSDKKVQEEKKNFQLLCGKCHKDKTHKAWDYSVPKSEHGTYWQYRKYNCRCEDCSKAYKAKIKEWREKSK